eukprot:364329-Chlamydomonas_euryale.AAC.4
MARHSRCAQHTQRSIWLLVEIALLPLSSTLMPRDRCPPRCRSSRWAACRLVHRPCRHRLGLNDLEGRCNCLHLIRHRCVPR